MKAVTWHGKRDVRVEQVPDPKIEEPTDAIIEITSTNICGSDLHLYEVLGPFMTPGDILGHEPMGIVREVGKDVTNLSVGDRVVIPFQISCGSCFMCDMHLYTQCETTQVRDQGMGAALFGFSELYGAVPGGQAELLRVPQAQFTHIKVPDGPPDSRFVYLSDVLPTAWQSVAYAGIPDGGSVTVLGLGPIGDMAARIAHHLGYDVIGVDMVPERLARTAARGIRTVDLREIDFPVGDAIRSMTDGRGTDSVWIASTRSTRRSTSCGAVARSRSSASTAVLPIRFRCSRCSTSRYRSGWVRRTSSAGSTTSCRCSPTTIRSGWTPSPATSSPSTKRRMRTTSSRRSRTTRSRSFSSRETAGAKRGASLRRVGGFAGSDDVTRPAPPTVKLSDDTSMMPSYTRVGRLDEMTLTTKVAAGLGGLALAAMAGSGIAAAAPGDAAIVNSTCTYPQVMAALNAQDPVAANALASDPAANGFLVGLIAAPPASPERQQKIDFVRSFPQAAQYNGLINSVATSCNNY
jgi:hemophore-related protein